MGPCVHDTIMTFLQQWSLTMFWGVGRESPVTGRTGAGGPWSLHTDVLGTEHQPPSLELQESQGSEGHRLFCIAQTQFFLLKYRQLSLWPRRREFSGPRPAIVDLSRPLVHGRKLLTWLCLYDSVLFIPRLSGASPSPHCLLLPATQRARAVILSALLTLRPLNTVPHVAMTPNHKIIFIATS